jgi:uncharacterized protein (TIGR03437 family)
MILRTTLALFVLFTGLSRAAGQSSPAYFTVSNEDGSATVSQQFVIKVTEPSIIQQAREILSHPASNPLRIAGYIVKAPSYFNAPWSFHLDPSSISFGGGYTEVCDAATSAVENHLSEVGQALLPYNFWCPWQSRLLVEVPPPPGADNSLRVVSAASGSEAAISPGALISLYGQNLTDRTEKAASLELPLTLAGVTVQIKANSEANGHQLPLLFASPLQVNALIPAGVPLGSVLISLTHMSGREFDTASYLEAIAPALFVIPQDNRDYAAATLLRIRADGTRSVEPLAGIDAQSGLLIPLPLDFGSPDDELYLSLYGTGFADSNAGTVSLTLVSKATPILYAGPQGQFPGLDQINIALPRFLRTESFVDLQLQVRSPNGHPTRTNTARILIGRPAVSTAGSAVR